MWRSKCARMKSNSEDEGDGKIETRNRTLVE